jgi:hypothetical protein
MDSYSAPKKMKPIGDLFAKYKLTLIAPQATVEKACAEAIKKITGLTVSAENITYVVNTKTLSIKVPSVLKSELRFHHKAILQELKKGVSVDNAPKTIR